MSSVWGRGWTTCLLHVCTLFGSHFKIRVSLEWDFIYLLLFLASVHGFMYETSDFFFYFIITFSYTKYFVHSYTVDVVFTLSYKSHLRRQYNSWSLRCSWRMACRPVGAAPTTSSFSTKHIASIACPKTTATRDEKRLSYGILCNLY